MLPYMMVFIHTVTITLLGAQREGLVWAGFLRLVACGTAQGSSQLIDEEEEEEVEASKPASGFMSKRSKSSSSMDGCRSYSSSASRRRHD